MVKRLLQEPDVLAMAYRQFTGGIFNEFNDSQVAIETAVANQEQLKDAINQLLPQPLAEEIGPELYCNYAYSPTALFRQNVTPQQHKRTAEQDNSSKRQRKAYKIISNKETAELKREAQAFLGENHIEDNTKRRRKK